jgi:hypothetical protein
MKDAKLKYGYLSSYEQTVFLKMVTKPKSSSWMILCSPIIYHNVETNREDQKAHCDPSSSAYSLRECFFAFMFHCLYNPSGDEAEDGNDDDEFTVLAKASKEAPKSKPGDTSSKKGFRQRFGLKRVHKQSGGEASGQKGND